MKRAVGILSTAIVPLFVAGMAFAAEPYRSHRGTHTHGATVGTTGFLGQHTMTGKITDIDKDKGRVTVESDGEELDLHFPKAALQNMSRGDQVTVSLGIKPANGTAGTRGSTSGMRRPHGSEPPSGITH